MSDAQLIEDAEARIAARHDVVALRTLEDSLTDVEERERWSIARLTLEECPWCAVRYSNLGGGLCRGCYKADRRRRLSELPKAEILRTSRTPTGLRCCLDWLANPAVWPISWRGHPTAEWVGRSDDPWVVLFHGRNGSGKSSRAAELLFRAYRHEPRTLMWVDERELLEESEGFPPYPLMHNASISDVLVFDELGITRDRRLIDAAWTVAQKLISYRYDRAKPTIITTHRNVVKGVDSIKDCSPSLFDRLKSGAICKTPDKSWR